MNLIYCDWSFVLRKATLRPTPLFKGYIFTFFIADGMFKACTFSVGKKSLFRRSQILWFKIIAKNSRDICSLNLFQVRKISDLWSSLPFNSDLVNVTKGPVDPP